MLEQDVKNVCSMDTLEAANSMSDPEVNDEHESFIFEEPQDTSTFEETPSPPAIGTHRVQPSLAPPSKKFQKGGCR